MLTNTNYHLALAFLLCLCGQAPAQEKSPYPKLDPGPAAVVSVTFDWSDTARDRMVPVRVYYPKDLTKPAPIIVFSHGTGGSRDGYAYLGKYWASHGYVSVHPQHAGSDSQAFVGKGNLLDAMKKAIGDPRNAIQRPKDVTFALDQLAKLNEDDDKFKGKLNLDIVGMSGHSFGAHTTLVTAGQAMGGLNVVDKRVKAIVPMSASVPKLNPDKAFAGVKVPMLLMTGTLDDSPLGDTKASERRVPYDKVTGVDKYFINFEGGDHMIFSGRLKNRAQDAEFQRAIKESTLAFWDAYLRGDAQAASWLRSGMRDHLGKLAAVEMKMAR